VDIRPAISNFSLDDDGFQVLQHSTQLAVDSFSDRTLVEEQYLGEVKEILKTIDGGYDKVFVFDWRVRENSHTKLGIRPDEAAAHKTVTGAKLCNSCGHWRVRHERPYDVASPFTKCSCRYVGPSSQTLLAGTVNGASADQSPRAVLHRIKLHLPDEANTLLRGRVRIIKY
jgi:hypothetical protein